MALKKYDTDLTNEPSPCYHSPASHTHTVHQHKQTTITGQKRYYPPGNHHASHL